jgi:EmrB/QacA subfamily drug resistance transporter
MSVGQPLHVPTASASAGSASPKGRSAVYIMAATILGSSLAFIDGTVVNVALPVLQRDLKATAADVQWVVEGYSLFLAALILVGGSLGDRFGRRKVYGFGVAIFSIASTVCGLAPTVSVLIAARAVQGIGGALLIPGSLAIITSVFTETAERGRAIGTWSAFTTLTSAVGPVLGGWLVQSVSWRAVFFINLPIAALVLLLLARHVPESRDESISGSIDWIGTILVTVGLAALVYGLITWGASGLKPIVIISVCAGVVCLIAFGLVEARSASPMLPLSLFRSRTFTGANLLTFLLYGALGGTLYFLPFYLQQALGYSATAAGAALVPLTVILFALSRWAGGLIARYGARLPLMVGPTIAAIGFFLLSLQRGGGSYWTDILPGVTVLGLGMAVTVAPLTTAVMSAVESRHAGVASGVNNAVSRTAGLLAIAVLGIVIAYYFSSGLDHRLNALHLAPAARHALDAHRDRLAALNPPSGLSPQKASAVRQAIVSSYIDGFQAVMRIGAGLALASALCAGLLVEGKPASRSA